MNYCKLELSNGYIYLKIYNNIQSGCSLLFLGSIGIIMFFAPILVTIFIIKELSFGVIMSWLIGWLVSGYFIRLYLWNKYGEEVFIIQQNKLETYYNYKFFKDNVRLYNYTKIDTLFFDGEKSFFTNKFKKKDNFPSTSHDQLSSIGFLVDDNVIRSQNKIPISEIIEIANCIMNLIN